MKRLLAALMLFSLPLYTASCSWWFETPSEPDSMEDSDTPSVGDSQDADTTRDALDALLGEDATGIPSIDSPRLAVLGDNLQFYRIEDEQCVVVYNEENAWMFDYRINLVTPLVELDAMIKAADTTGRGAAYFDDCTIGYDFYLNSDLELRIEYAVEASSGNASLEVYNFYTLYDEGEYSLDSKRGDVRGYYFERIDYPGSDTPVVIYDLAEYAKLGVNEDDILLRTASALVQNDVTALEEVCRLDTGTLSSWEGMVVSEYSLTREDFSSSYADELILMMAIKESPLERYPAGEYRVTLADGIAGPIVAFDGVNAPADGNDYKSGSAEEWAYIWAGSFGGWYPLVEMTPSNDSYAHQMLHFLSYTRPMCKDYPEMSTGEDFKRLRGIYFPDGDIQCVYDTDFPENCAHGGTTKLCTVRETMAASGIHIVTVTYYADPMRSVVARELRVTLTELGDGNGYAISNVECTYESDLGIYGWSV